MMITRKNYVGCGAPDTDNDGYVAEIFDQDVEIAGIVDRWGGIVKISGDVLNVTMMLHPEEAIAIDSQLRRAGCVPASKRFVQANSRRCYAAYRALQKPVIW